MNFDFTKNIVLENERVLIRPLMVMDFENLKTANQYAGSTSFYAVSNKDERLAIGATWIGKPFQRTGLNRNMEIQLQYFLEIMC